MESPDDLPPHAASTRSLAVAQLRRAASLRDNTSPSPSPSPSTSPAPSPYLPRTYPTSNSPSESPKSPPVHLPSPSPSSSSTPHPTTFFLPPSPLPSTSASSDAASSLSRTASVLARSLAMAKLTGSKPPTPPPTFFSSSPSPRPGTPGSSSSHSHGNGGGGFMGPSLDELRERAELRRAASLGKGAANEFGGSDSLRRNNTVDGGGALPSSERQMDRAEARVNLMRKLSGRRLESPAPSSLIEQGLLNPDGGLPLPHPLAVVGKRGKARPRSGSLGEYSAAKGVGDFLKARERDWRREVRRGTEDPVPQVGANEEENQTPTRGRGKEGGRSRGGEGNFSFHVPVVDGNVVAESSSGTGLQVPPPPKMSLSAGHSPLRQSREFDLDDSREDTDVVGGFLKQYPTASSVVGEIEYQGGKGPTLLEQELVAKVEKNMVVAQQHHELLAGPLMTGRSQKLYPFLPPDEGYKFPPPPSQPSAKTETAAVEMRDIIDATQLRDDHHSLSASPRRSSPPPRHHRKHSPPPPIPRSPEQSSDPPRRKLPLPLGLPTTSAPSPVESPVDPPSSFSGQRLDFSKSTPMITPTGQFRLATNFVTPDVSTPISTSPSTPMPSSGDSPSSPDSDDSFPFSPEIRHERLPESQLPGHRILAHLDSVLGTEELDSSEPSFLDHPPRSLLLELPVLQVVNISTVKDRHLFIFNDLLIIAKPIIEDGPTGQPLSSTINNSFLVKNLVQLKNLKLEAIDDPSDPDQALNASKEKPRHPLLVEFVRRFGRDPRKAIEDLIAKGGLTRDPTVIANIIYRHPDLDHSAIGAFLSVDENRPVLRAFIDRFKFSGVRIDDALRMFLLSFRMPSERKKLENVLSTMALKWSEVNIPAGLNHTLSLSLIKAIIRLSYDLHDGGAPASLGDFVALFRDRSAVSDELLTKIYHSVRRDRIEEASDNSIEPDIEATIFPHIKHSFKVSYRSPSDPITITIPTIDPYFSIKLSGVDLTFYPPILSFSKSNSQSFTVTASNLGTRTISFIKLGPNAPRYIGIPLNRTVTIERAFLRHTFQVSFVNHLDAKRKYMFSTPDAASRREVICILRDRIAKGRSNPAPSTKSLLAAETVAFQILRDALIPPEDTTTAHSHSPAPSSPAAILQQQLRSRLGGASSRAGTPTGAGQNEIPGGRPRSNSISKTYDFGMGKGELGLKETNKLAVPSPGLLSVAASVPLPGARRRGSKDEVEKVSAFAKDGKEIVVITEQNSLLPVVLSFLGVAAQVAPDPLSVHGSAFQLPPLSPFHIPPLPLAQQPFDDDWLGLSK